MWCPFLYVEGAFGSYIRIMLYENFVLIEMGGHLIKTTTQGLLKRQFPHL